MDKILNDAIEEGNLTIYFSRVYSDYSHKQYHAWDIPKMFREQRRIDRKKKMSFKKSMKEFYFAFEQIEPKNK